jgi:hypothetical protein
MRNTGLDAILGAKHIHQAEDYEGLTGGERIQAAIAAASTQPGHNLVVAGPTGPDQDGRWILERAIELPSHTTLLLVGAYLFLADNANCNLVQNQDLAKGNADIHVIGIGGARLDGNAGNQARPTDGRDVEIWMQKQGMKVSVGTREVIGNMSVAEFEKGRATEGVYRSSGVRFYNVQDLTIQGLTIGPTNMFAMRIERVSNVRISGITLAQDGREPNQDGIHIVGPAERVTISEIIGTCGDDAIALETCFPFASDHWYEGTIPRDLRRAGAGPITGIAINNVVISNRWCTGILRTVALPGYPIDGVHASNLQLLESPGHSEAHAVLKFGTARPGYEGGEQCGAAEHANITVENVFAKDWRGPFCAVFSPIKNLTVRGARGSHTGFFFHNFGQAIDGLVLEDCSTTLVGGPEEPFVTGMIAFSIENYGLEGTLLDGTPAAIILDGGPLKDVGIRDVSMTSALKASDLVTGTGIAGLRLGPEARVHSLRVSGLMVDGYESGIIIGKGTHGREVQIEGVRMRNVASPWVVAGQNVAAVDLALGLPRLRLS